ncbi:MAG TPA: hypothetical protein VFQ85_15995 [Mycobacteriales bacterium]|jgi:hypothetical protein|nr:hypothetical protein [Mycobacteriales bacterium]
MRRAPAATAVLAVLLLGACTRTVDDLPDRADPAVHAEEQRLAALLGRGAVLSRPGPCAVRLLGRDGATSYAWAECRVGDEAVSLPVRVDGERVRYPGDGGAFARDVRRLFPRRLEDVILRAPDGVRPTELP